MTEADAGPSRFTLETLLFHDVTCPQAGIIKGYQDKPCLDPSEPDCPRTAPNRKTGKVRGLRYIVRSCFIPCYEKYSLSQYKKATVYSTG